MAVFDPQRFAHFPVIGILRGFQTELCVEIADVAAEAGLRALEVTVNSPNATATLRSIRARVGEQLMVGAGTVCTEEQLAEVLDAGASFIVSPITDVKLIARCRELEIPIFPGAMTPSEVYRAWDAGAAMVKLFPAGQLGSDYMRALRGPLDTIPLLPTGGITLENAAEFIAAGAAGLGVGSPLFQPSRMFVWDWDWLNDQVAAFRSLFR